MSQRTLWEQGTRPGRQVATLASAATLVVVLGHLLLTRQLSIVFDVAFVIFCVAAALAVRPREFFVVGVLPPMLMLAAMVTVALVARGAIAEAGDGLIQAVVSGLAHDAGALVVGYGLTLVILALRQMAAQKRLPAQTAQRRRLAPVVRPENSPQH